MPPAQVNSYQAGNASTNTSGQPSSSGGDPRRPSQVGEAATNNASSSNADQAAIQAYQSGYSDGLRNGRQESSNRRAASAYSERIARSVTDIVRTETQAWKDTAGRVGGAVLRTTGRLFGRNNGGGGN